MRHRCSRTTVLLLALAAAAVDPVPGEPVPDPGSESVEAQAPDLRIAGWEIDDTATGNGDLALQPGETAEIRVYLYNAGNQNAQGVYGQLAEVTDHPDVEVTGKVATWPDISAFETLTGSTTTFEIQVAATRPCSWEIPLEMQIVAGGGYFFEQRLTLSLRPIREIELAKDAGRPLIYGADMLDRFGSTSAAGDLNGDGLDDLIVGTYQAYGLTDFNPLTGEVMVRYGTPDRWADADLASPPGSIGIIYPVSLSDQFGWDVATGDTDSNGQDEILIGFARSDGPAGMRTDAGAVVALIGNDALTGSIDLNAPPPDVYFGTFHGVDPGDELGKAVVAADLNGDGFEEIVAAAWNADGSTNAGDANGEVVIVYGRLFIFAGDYDLASPSIPMSVIWGADPFDNLGRDLAAGDLDGDGYDDLILVSYGSGPDNLRTSAGEVVVVYGGPDVLPDVDLADPARPANVIRIYGRENDALRSAATGDLDGDGYDELILGGSGGSTGTFDAGVAYVLYGGPARYGDVDLRTPPPGVGIISGLATGAETGSSLGVADLDGDGYGDLLIGSPEASPPGLSSAGIVSVLPGGPERIDFLSLQFPPATVTNILGTSANQDLIVGAAGDFDGDGLDDLVLGIPSENGPANEFGTRGASGEVQ
ncbi:MAG: FG-GAP repeat protein, partial [Acidobacteriota bacterium]